nr:retrovirus-related Pol polyprotein from transposon TNT 1-94 [Tanacetum cinerariifolium]
MKNVIEQKINPTVEDLATDVDKFYRFLKEEMVEDLKYFNSLEKEIKSLKSQLELQRTQFSNEIDRLSKKYYYADYMNAILGVYTKLDEVTDLQCDYLDQVAKCQRLEIELSKRNTTSNSFLALEQHVITFELALQECQHQIKQDQLWKQKESSLFQELNDKFFEIQELKAQLQDKNITITEHIIVVGAENRPPMLEKSIFSQQINDMHTIGMTMQQVQVNTKFLNALPSEWSKFVTDVKLAKSLYTTNYDQLYAYLSQHERHVSETMVSLFLQFSKERIRLTTSTKQLFKMEESQLNKFKEDKLRVSLALETKELLQPQGETIQLTIPQNLAFQTEDLEAYDSDCDDISLAKVVLMANLSSCDSNVLFEIPYFDTYLNDMINQDVQQMSYSKQTHSVDFLDNEITSDSNINPYS